MSQFRVRYVGKACSMRFMGKKFKPQESVVLDEHQDKAFLEAVQYEQDFEVWPLVEQPTEPKVVAPKPEVDLLPVDGDAMPPADLDDLQDIEVQPLADDAKLPVLAKKGKSKR